MLHRGRLISIVLIFSIGRDLITNDSKKKIWGPRECTIRCHSRQKPKVLVMKWAGISVSVFSRYFSMEIRWPTSWWCSSVTTCRLVETSGTTWLVYSVDRARPLLLLATWLPSKCCLWKRWQYCQVNNYFTIIDSDFLPPPRQCENVDKTPDFSKWLTYPLTLWSKL